VRALTRRVVRRLAVILAAGVALAASASALRAQAPRQVPTEFAGAAASAPAVATARTRAMAVHFYDVGQGLAVLVDLPDRRHVLFDAGDSPRRPGCDGCADRNRKLLEKLGADLQGAPIDLLWISHPHSDHVGGAPEVLETFDVRVYVDNGLDLRRAEVRDARRAAERRGVPVRVVDPDHRQVPLADAGDVRLTAVLPGAWPRSCREDPNECSIALRVDFGASSVLLMGDAEHQEEVQLEPLAPVTLLQVAHHGSDTSTTPAFLARTRPRYAVISAGRPGEGTNREYCHPRALIVRRLTRVLGGAGDSTLEAFDGERCDRATPSDWTHVPASDRLWAAPRDGDVTLVTSGDGTFERREGR
jgi:competence protein ComEC